MQLTQIVRCTCLKITWEHAVEISSNLGRQYMHYLEDETTYVNVISGTNFLPLKEGWKTALCCTPSGSWQIG